jgi:hypothetical protein
MTTQGSPGIPQKNEGATRPYGVKNRVRRQ